MTKDRNVPGKLENKVAVITGAAQGIGAAIADVFASEGASLALLDKNSDAIIEKGEQVASQYAVPVWTDTMDVSGWDEVSAMGANVAEQFGKIDILVNNAGKNVFADPLNADSDTWERCLGINLMGAWNCSRSVLPFMLANGRGSIVNIASVHAHRIIPGSFPYPVAKHGLMGLTKALALEYATQGIRVNSVSPGLIRTPATDAFFDEAEDPEEARRATVDLIPCKRIGEPKEVAMTALFLASDDATFINAADILIDGGRSQLYHE